MKSEKIIGVILVLGILFLLAYIKVTVLGQEQPKLKSTKSNIEVKKEISKDDMEKAYEQLMYQSFKLDSLIFIRRDTLKIDSIPGDSIINLYE
jgi:glucose-6-phosphate 1-dehydrogenase